MTNDDQARRDVIAERARNVIVDASAGTGKTALIVERWLELVAPHDARPAIPIDRLVAITFTRKAAGELRIRIRQRMLEALAALPPTDARAALLREALFGIDTAQIATIHGFADHLLRMWPAHTGLDAHYQLDEDEARLHRACFESLVHAAETGTLAQLVAGTPAAARADEATETICELERAGLRLRSRETEHWTYHGLDHLIADMLRQRDLPWHEPAACPFDHAAFARVSAAYQQRIAGLTAGSPGARWLLDLGERLRALHGEHDPALLCAALVERLTRGPRDKASDPPTKKHDFGGDHAAWQLWKAFAERASESPALRDQLLAPLRHWLAIRLVRLRPVVLQAYEQLKAQRQVVDHGDLLIRLRDLLRDHREIRSHCQQCFDHVFVDELQDTDPLQAEIIAFLCERSPSAARWRDVELAAGKLTVVGDPKQSIYRFRRADITTYHDLIALIERGPHVSAQLTASFRTAPQLVDWINLRCGELMGSHGERFQLTTGEVRYRALSHGRTDGAGPAVRIVPFAPAAGALADDSRALEAETMARYLRWLVTMSDVKICDPVSREARPIRFADIAVLALTTTTLHLLFAALDRHGIPHAARGGRVFVDDPLHRQFLLGLCAIADRDDGVAVAALLGPPFFALDFSDLVRDGDPTDRATAARAIVRELRQRRFERRPGSTARALLEHTAFGRMVALGANGAQRLRGLRELCFQIDRCAHDHQLDFDATMERIRAWVDDPPELDLPFPIDGDTLRVSTVHQAKGLEFPVVMLWDARATWREPPNFAAWTSALDGSGWELRLDLLRWAQPANGDIVETERKMREAERKRLIYVAITRARDLLILPRADGTDDRHIFHRLIGAGQSRSDTVHEEERHTPLEQAAWFAAAAPPPITLPSQVTTRDDELARDWVVCVRDASQPWLVPIAFTQAASPRLWWGKRGRHGTTFGQTVHAAIGAVLTGPRTLDEAVQAAATRHGLDTHLREAREDVARALDTLRSLRIDEAPHCLEYAIAGVSPGGGLIAGYADLVVVPPAGPLLIIDFKTDAPPSAFAPIPRSYVEQVHGYAHALERALALASPPRAGLLFTADGEIRWLS